MLQSSTLQQVEKSYQMGKDFNWSDFFSFYSLHTGKIIFLSDCLNFSPVIALEDWHLFTCIDWRIINLRCVNNKYELMSYLTQFYVTVTSALINYLLLVCYLI